MLKFPTHVQLEVTDTCNLRCYYCYHFNTKEMPKSNDLEHRQVIELVEKMVDAHVYSLVITGGEPLARPDLIIEAVKIAKPAGMFVSINTNLLLLTEKILKDLKSSGVDSFLISCPASDPLMYRQITHCGDYKKWQSKLELVIASGISCMVNMVVTPVNHKFIRSTAEDVSKIGVRRFSATPASLNVEYPNNDDLLSRQQTNELLEDLRWCAEQLGLEVDILEPMPKCFFPSWCWEKEYLFTKRVCQAGRLSVSISNIGDVRPCSHNPIVYGNLFKDSLEDIWARMEIYRNSSIPIFCTSCPSVSSCNGACRTNSLANTGTFNMPDRLISGHVNLPKIKKQGESIKESSCVYFNGNLRWRCEGSCYSTTTKKSAGNLLVVNKELFDFIIWLNNHLPLTIKELGDGVARESKKEDFLNVIEYLIKKEFIYLI
jgi:radical SAM protein with 4Fe4S-binding SPASM domain